MQYVVLISVVGLSVLPGAAWASASSGQILGELPECVVERGVASFDIPVNADVMTALHFPGKLKEGTRPRGSHRDFKVKVDKGTLLVAPRGNRQNVTTTLLVETTNPRWEVSLFVHAVDSPDKALKACRFVGLDEIKAR